MRSQRIVCKKAESKRRQQEKPECRTDKKEERYKSNGATGAPGFFFGKRRLHKAPELPENIRKCNNEPTHYGNGNTGHELGGKGGGLHGDGRRGHAKRILNAYPMAEPAKRGVGDKIL